jgi:hypothetical protein|tara:strand:- start:1582 stop:2187 length:606 start_codon:yes stop_codon:yes gene_type:complete
MIILIFILLIEQVPHLASFCRKITKIVGVSARLQRNPLHNFYPETLKRFYLAGIIGQQSDSGYLQVPEHRLTDTVIAQISAKTELLIGFHGVGSGILKVVCPDFVEQPYTPPFLAKIKNGPATFGGNTPHRLFQLCTTVTADAEKCITGKALGVNAQHNRSITGDVTHGNGHVLFIAIHVFKAVNIKHPPASGQFGAFNKT